mgnify:CR=1 FL=1
MTFRFLAVVALAALPLSAQAAMSPKDAQKAEMSREGNLASVATTYFQTKVQGATPDYCGDTGTAVTTTSTMKVSADSSFKKETGTYIYEGTYVVSKACYTGSTQSGAYRDLIESALVKCAREGTLDSATGAIRRTKRDVCSLVKKLTLQ